MKVRTICWTSIVTCLLAIAANQTLTADTLVPMLRLDPNLPYQAERANSVSYDVDFAVIVTAPHHTQKLRIWLPLLPSDVGQEVEPGVVTTFPIKVQPQIGTEKVYGNRFAYFQFEHPEGAQIIRHQFRIKIWELNWQIDPQRLTKVDSWPTAFEPYRGSDRSIAVDDKISSFAKHIVKEHQEAAYNLDAVMAWLQQNMTYDHTKSSLNADALRAFETRTGHCSDYHGLCASFGRALGLPTRMTYGIHAFSKNSPSHCKLEAFLAPYGWVSFDVSETQRMVHAIQNDQFLPPTEKATLVKAAQDRLKYGFRDNTWFLQTKGTDYALEPPASQKVRLIRTIYAEADGKPLPDPDPADPTKREFAWMTAHRFTPDRPVPYPFTDPKSLIKRRSP